MKTVYSLTKSEGGCCTALGFFDGVHLGHREVISTAVENAAAFGVESCVLTFSRRPKSILTGERDMLLTTEDEKIRLIESLGVDTLYILDFSRLMNLSGEDFVKRVLIDTLSCRGVVCGFNYRFGKGGKCGSRSLEEICGKYGCQSVSKKPVLYNGEYISSSRIRAALKDGDIFSANRMLGHSFGYRLRVVHGRKLGRTIGVPTINQIFPEDFCLPKFGVYASILNIRGKEYYGVTNIGVKPTVGSDRPLSETWILNYSGELYGESIDLRLSSFIRPERKFDSIAELKRQIERDSEKVRKAFGLSER